MSLSCFMCETVTTLLLQGARGLEIPCSMGSICHRAWRRAGISHLLGIGTQMQQRDHEHLGKTCYLLMEMTPAEVLPSCVTSGATLIRVGSSQDPVLSRLSHHILAACPLSGEDLQVLFLIRTGCIYNLHVTESKASGTSGTNSFYI